MPKTISWKQLAGKRVVVSKDGEVLRTGFVKDVLASADVLWLEAEGFRQRQLFDKSMGYSIAPEADPVLN